MDKNIEDNIIFTPGLNDRAVDKESAFYYIFFDQSILLKTGDGGPVIPVASDLAELGLSESDKLYFGRMNDFPCYIIWLDKEIDTPGNFSFANLRSVYGILNDDLFWIAGRAFHLGSWINTHKFCGRCAGKMELKKEETALVCPDCNLTVFPQISPAVIMAIIRDGKILLAHNNRWKNPMFSTLAGFVDVGESLEECVRREVREEAGIEIKNIKYFGSQPWHFTGSLMIAFTAEYAGGELNLDKSELRDGGWFSADDLPVISRKPSIARQLIDWFVNKHS
jgi:NAD+ diphosphatase